MPEDLEPQSPEAAPQPSETPAAPPPQVREKHHTGFREYVESLLVTVILALFGTTFVVQAFKIPSSSMEPTLLVGDHLLVNKFVFGGRGAWYERALPYRPIRRGDIIVFKFPYDDHIHYVKRVIGLPGDHVRIRDKQVFINGTAIEEPYKVHDGRFDHFSDNFPPARADLATSAARREWAAVLMNYVEEGELVVPPGKYFVMGDNRDTSLDSRFWGFADASSVMGRPILIYWSVEATTDDYTDRSLNGRIKGLLLALRELPAKTRWSRMLQPVH